QVVLGDGDVRGAAGWEVFTVRVAHPDHPVVDLDLDRGWPGRCGRHGATLAPCRPVGARSTWTQWRRISARNMASVPWRCGHSCTVPGSGPLVRSSSTPGTAASAAS